MRGCLFTLLLGAIVIGFVIVVGLPAAAAGILTAGLSTAGLVADDTTVTVTSDPPTDFLGLRADSVRVTATDATFRGMEIGALDLALGDVQILERTAGSVDGQLTDVTLHGCGRPAGHPRADHAPGWPGWDHHDHRHPQRGGRRRSSRTPSRPRPARARRP